MADPDGAMVGDPLRFELATPQDADRLAAIRVDTMRPSLEAAGRFDPERARDRFLVSFEATDTKIIYSNDQIVGFFVVRHRLDHLYLDHLYIIAPAQGRGIGRRIIKDVQDEARSAGVSIRLNALNGSPANGFYQSCGFVCRNRDALDSYYDWAADH